MGRWEPNAHGRLEQAALELFRERGYARTTVEDIAARAGLTERTFFRYFTDKREVLFSGSAALQKLLVDAVTDAPAAATPLDAVAAALDAAGAMLQERRDHDYVRARHALVTTHAELQERELIKLASLASAVAEALRGRGVPEPAASLAAETGIAVFKVAFAHWVEDAKRRDLPGHMRAAFDELRAVTAVTSRAPSTSGASKPEKAPPQKPLKRRRSRE